jgi:hypothetical protein
VVGSGDVGARTKDNLPGKHCATGDSVNVPHSIALDGISILVSTSDSDAVTCFAEVGEAVRADLKLGLVERGIAVCGSLNQTELRPVGGVCAVYVERECDCSISCVSQSSDWKIYTSGIGAARASLLRLRGGWAW